MIGAYNTRGGLERVAVEYARGLVRRGHTVTVFTQSVQREHADDGVTFHRVGGIRSQIALRAATFPFAATRAVRTTRQDVLLSFGSSLMRPAVVRLPGAHRSWWEVANAEWPVTTLDGLRRRVNPHHRITMWLDEQVLGKGLPSEVLAAGDWAAQDIRRFYPAVAERVSILPDGVNLSEFAFDETGRRYVRDRWGAGEGPLLLTVATELRRKGLDTLFEAFHIVRREVPEATLVVGGKAPQQDVRALIAHHKLAREVRAVGFIEDLRAAYSAADLLIFPTRFDPWGLPVIEALACGTPVAVSARAGAAQAIDASANGSTIQDPSDPEQVAGAVLATLALRADRAAVRATAIPYSWEQVVDTLEKTLARHADR